MAGRAGASSGSTGSSAPRPTSGIRTWSTTTIRSSSPRSPEEGYHLTVDLTDKALEFIRDAKAVAPDKPFFLYFCPGACHAPHHAPKEWIDKYRGKFDMGYEAYRELVFERQKQMGVIPDKAELSPINPYIDEKSADGKGWPELDTVRPWDSLTDDEKRLFRRMAEVYAGFLSHADHEIGRLLDYLEQSGQLDNTIIVLVSDNGASGEGGPNGSVNENKIFNGLPDNIEENLPYLEDLGGPTTYNHYPTGWAWAFNTPFKLWKRYSNYEGGTADPMIVSWPAQITATGLRRQYVHAVDIVPTIYDASGSSRRTRQGLHAVPARGHQLRRHLQRRRRRRRTSRRSSTRWAAPGRSGTRAGRRPRSRRPLPTCGRTTPSSAGSCSTPTKTPRECHDLAGASSRRSCRSSSQLWWAQAGQYGALPLENRDALEILTTDRPQLTKPRNRYVYYPGCAEVPESVAPNIRNRSYTVAVEVDHRHRGGRRGPVRPRVPVRRPRPLHQGRQAQVRLQLGGRHSSRSSSRPSRCPPATSSSRRPSSARATRCRPRAP